MSRKVFSSITDLVEELYKAIETSRSVVLSDQTDAPFHQTTDEQATSQGWENGAPLEVDQIVWAAPSETRNRLDVTPDAALGGSEIAQWASKIEPTCLWPQLQSSKCRVGIRTSGTTGRPKIVWQTMNDLLRAIRTGEKYRDDRWGLTYSPIRYAGLQVILQAWLNGNFLVDLRASSKERWSEAIAEHQLTCLSGTPSFFRLLCSEGRLFSDVRRVTLGGEVVDAELWRRIVSSFPAATVRNVYASTELGSVLSSRDGVFTVSPEQRNLIQIENGELLVASSLVVDRGVSRCDSDVWPTGDEVELLNKEPLQFRFTGRRTDWINVGGNKVNPQAVERAVERIDGVVAARVYGQPNSVLGSILHCDLQMVEQTTLDVRRLKQALRSQLAKHEIPQLIHFVKRIELSANGKKQRS